MKKLFCLFLAALCLTGMLSAASAERSFEALFELFSSEDVFGEAVNIFDYVDENATEEVKVCFVIFLFDQENDMTIPILIGRNAENEEKYVQWIADFEPGAATMVYLLTTFADLKEISEEGVDLALNFSFDGGETMTTVDTPEAAQEVVAQLQSLAAP